MYMFILIGGNIVSRQFCLCAGLLHVGDVIKEVDGVEVKDPEQLSDMIRRAKGSMTFKIIPSNWDQNARSHVGYTVLCYAVHYRQH